MRSLQRKRSVFAFASVMTTLVVIGPGSNGFASIIEPNETPSAAIVLPEGVRNASGRLESAQPDTVLGIFNAEDQLLLVDDDGSTFGNGLASALKDVAFNAAGAARVKVTGFGDFDFDGLNDFTLEPHDQFGRFDLFLQYFNPQFLGNTVVTRDLRQGQVEEFNFAGASYVGGTYNAEIDNRKDSSDVDFWRFTGLMPGQAWQVNLLAPSGPAILGSFSVEGEILSTAAPELLGQLVPLTGVANAQGEALVAVTGISDQDFVGSHSVTSDYELQLITIPEPSSLLLLVLAISGLSLRRSIA